MKTPLLLLRHLVGFVRCSFTLPPERTPHSQPGLAACWRAQHSAAAGAHHHVGGVAEHHCDLSTASALDVDEVAVGALDEPFELVLLQDMHSGCRGEHKAAGASSESMAAAFQAWGLNSTGKMRQQLW